MATQILTSPQELAKLASTEPVVIIDTRTPEEYALDHIPGAVNIRDIFTYLVEDSSSETMQSLQNYFAGIFGNAGLSGTETAVIYEDALDGGYGQSCRGYFLLKYLGYENVSILHGGYQAWKAEGLSITDELPQLEPKPFPLQLNAKILLSKEDMLKVLEDSSIVKLDVRDRDEWMAESSSPYGKDFCPRKGRIPNSVWIEWYDFMDCSSDIPLFRSPAEVLDICTKAGITPQDPVYIYCFKGSRASNTLVALTLAGFTDVRNYFASWNEWSRDAVLPIEMPALATV